jgi:hypothetical protein
MSNNDPRVMEILDSGSESDTKLSKTENMDVVPSILSNPINKSEVQKLLNNDIIKRNNNTVDLTVFQRKEDKKTQWLAFEPHQIVKVPKKDGKLLKVIIKFNARANMRFDDTHLAGFVLTLNNYDSQDTFTLLNSELKGSEIHTILKLFCHGTNMTFSVSHNDPNMNICGESLPFQTLDDKLVNKKSSVSKKKEIVEKGTKDKKKRPKRRDLSSEEEVKKKIKKDKQRKKRHQTDQESSSINESSEGEGSRINKKKEKEKKRRRKTKKWILQILICLLNPHQNPKKRNLNRLKLYLVFLSMTSSREKREKLKR